MPIYQVTAVREVFHPSIHTWMTDRASEPMGAGSLRALLKAFPKWLEKPKITVLGQVRTLYYFFSWNDQEERWERCHIDPRTHQPQPN